MFSSQNSQASSDVNYIDDVFSTWLYKGNGSTQSIANGINLSGKGGLWWGKQRNSTGRHWLLDSYRGGNIISTNLTDAQTVAFASSPFTSTGLSFTSANPIYNESGSAYTGWTFREQPKFFDVVTYTGNSVSPRQISHNLGSDPGCVIIKKTSGSAIDWVVWHRGVSSPAGAYGVLNQTLAFGVNSDAFYFSNPTSTYVTVGSADTVNTNGATYVMYLFAHNAGGFGLTGTDNVISCGSFTTDGTGAAGNITLGYEAQWLLIKRSDGVGSWNIIDVMRGSSLTSYNYLQPNASTQESSSTSAGQGIFPTATGFYVGNNFPAASATYIYMAIRRPMKVPTLGTSVFSVDTTTADSAITSTLKQTDMGWFKDRTTVANWFVADRLRGFTNAYYTPTLYINATDAEVTPTTGDTVTAFGPTTTGVNNGVIYAGGAGVAGNYPLLYSFKRAPGFFDEVCYTGTGVARTVAHNLTVAPELWIIKSRSNGNAWIVGSSLSPSISQYMFLMATQGWDTLDFWNNTRPSTTNVYLSSQASVNGLGLNFVGYLFATLAGVSKVGSYTGTGALQTVACGFTSGARFVLIKRTDSAGDWYVWDSTRGISSGTDPYLTLNTTAAEVTSTNWVDTTSTGFQVTAASGNNVNINGASYIFLSVA